ncbi:MAG TPA: hypothetical protein VHQ90_00630 [Thermoanaerobaculia bacterium]|nr:hypothetical protein [Thermoanaerobaculia bacterium]
MRTTKTLSAPPLPSPSLSKPSAGGRTDATASGASETSPATGPFFTVRQIAERHPAFGVRTLRHWITNAAPRHAWKDRRAVILPGNGFDTVMVRVGRRIFINEAALLAWLARGSTQGSKLDR